MRGKRAGRVGVQWGREHTRHMGRSDRRDDGRRMVRGAGGGEGLVDTVRGSGKEVGTHEGLPVCVRVRFKTHTGWREGVREREMHNSQ